MALPVLDDRGGPATVLRAVDLQPAPVIILLAATLAPIRQELARWPCLERVIEPSVITLSGRVASRSMRAAFNRMIG